MNLKTLLVAAPLVLGTALTASAFRSAAPAPTGTDPAAFASAAATETYRIDPAHSGVVFRVQHLGVSYFHGRFNQVTGSYELNTEDMTEGSVEVEIQADSVDTNNADRDKHLESSDFFDAKQFPVIKFRSTDVRAAGDDNYAVTGELELHGVTKEIEAEMTYVGSGEDPWGGHRSGFEARFQIQRSDFGMSYMVDNGALGDEVDVTVFVEGVRQEK